MTIHDHPTRRVTDVTPELPVISGEELYLRWRPDIERTIAAVVRRHGMSGADVEEFAAWATGRLIEHDAAILRKFGGRSSTTTYLVVVLGNLLHDYRNAIWGRWRPSALALRLGPTAVRLEELIIRDACPLRDAIGMLRSTGVPESEAQLSRWAAQLAHRISEREVPIENAAEQHTSERADTLAAAEERTRVLRTLRDAIAQLPAEDQLLLRLRFETGMAVADIARWLTLDPKPLYRRLEGIARRLHGTMTRHGVSKGDVLELIAEDRRW